MIHHKNSARRPSLRPLQICPALPPHPQHLDRPNPEHRYTSDSPRTCSAFGPIVNWLPRRAHRRPTPQAERKAFDGVAFRYALVNAKSGRRPKALIRGLPPLQICRQPPPLPPDLDRPNPEHHSSSDSPYSCSGFGRSINAARSSRSRSRLMSSRGCLCRNEAVPLTRSPNAASDPLDGAPAMDCISTTATTSREIEAGTCGIQRFVPESFPVLSIYE